MIILCKVLFILLCFHVIAVFGGLTRLRIQQQTREKMSENGRKKFDQHQKAMEQLAKLSNQIHDVKPSKDDSKFDLAPMANPSMYQGDMILNKHQAEYLLNEAKMRLEAKHANKSGAEAEKEIVKKLKKNRAYKKDSPFQWTFPIPYYIDGNVPHGVVDNAIKGIEKETCIRFKKSRPFNDRQGLRIFPGEGCYSLIGPSSDNEPQDISIGEGCEWNGIIQHEVSHALGLFHEQSRPDRDNYLTLNLNNVDPNMRFNYDKSSIDETETFGIKYDYGSHMQYDKKAFSSNGQLTMIPKNKLYLNLLGQFDKMQFNDVKLLNTIYCANECDGGVKCNAGGYLDPNNCDTCKCPFMLGGQTCSEVTENPPECDQENSLEATSEEQSLNLEGIKKCIYEIRAKDNKKVKIRIIQGFFNDSEYCFPEIALQIKYHKDKTLVGPTFCGEVTNQALTSHDNQVLISYVGTQDDHMLQLNYKAV